MKFLKTVMMLSTLAVGIQYTSATPAEAGIFKNRRQGGSRGHVSRKARRGTFASRYAEREQRAIDRLGIEKFEKRRAFWHAFADGLSGAADGASSSLNNWNYSNSNSSYYRSPNFSNQLQWNNFNRNYSTNPDHAPVYGR
ncbi:hypothetical protein [Gimesia fumaroli]|uniref:Uncharacterized protein n=1 Tax=Gimesia fumaroli TaxID=2527976 RepID=A0A518I530_9PLAN|nr:hypothetical protein [Gimesia fumaroli]QDV48177.1 hypothetical protein Enr17x_01860 [Gimesia fumaroli]